VIDTAFFLESKTDFDMQWAYYELLTHDINSMDSGSAIPSTSRDAFYRLPVRVPPKNEQRVIAHILGTLDSKIELHRQMNDTLEAIARAIFKSWFVDFNPVRAKAEGRNPGLPKHIADLFPDCFHDSEMGPIPKGWDIKAIGDVAERVAMGPFGSSIKVETFVSDGVPIISGQHLHGFMLEDNTFNFITHEHAKRLGNAIVQRGDVVFTHAGNIGQAAFIPDASRYEHYIISQRQFFLRCGLSRITPTYIALYFNSPKGRNLLLANTSSSGVPSIARPVTYLRSIRLPIPKKVVLDAFERLMKPFLLLYRQNLETNMTLASLRDTLLPKLISGELRLKDAERLLGSAI
jgi:type I restriction enzyme S subunit